MATAIVWANPPEGEGGAGLSEPKIPERNAVSELGDRIADLLRTWPVRLDVREDCNGRFVLLEIDGAYPTEEAALVMASYRAAELDRHIAAVWTPDRHRTYFSHHAPDPVGEADAVLEKDEGDDHR